MAERKSATKTSKRASINIPKAKKSKSKSNKNIQKNLKKTSFSALATAFIFLIVGACIGAGVWYVTCKNDCFMLLGRDELTLTLEESYTEQGVKIVAFGKDDSQNFTVETNLQVNPEGEYYATEEGTYYIKYKTTNVKYSTIFTIEKIRLITFVEPSEQEEIDSANQ